MSKLFRLSTLALAAGTMLASGSAWAASATSTMNVSASVTALCEVTAPTLAFATNLNWNSATDTTSENISVTCTADTAYTISIDGENANVSGGKRRMKYNDGVDDHFMPYTLTNSLAAEILTGADATNDNYDTVTSFSGTGSAITHQVNGEVLATDLDALPAGAYSDAVVVTVTY